MRKGVAMERFVEGMKLCDERGFTSVGMAVALLLTLALLFSTAQVYRLNSASAEIQEVADVAALAAESEVADFIWAARKADAVVLTMTLVALSLYGVGVWRCACPWRTPWRPRCSRWRARCSRRATASPRRRPRA